ncbi:unnamed protein product [Orchesella dallaii]|uniref:G-protein coupled receptors family 1 profile domain-containing protein n=1 Tax=Orchesella dallaii TaxID=48710 RepID=A0ABP1RQB1_9HEXA
MERKPERLDFWTCFFLDSNSHSLVIHLDNEITKNYSCKSHGIFFANEESSYNGHDMCITLCVLIFIVGISGIITNLFNVVLLRNSFGKVTCFKESLILLAVIELFLCFFTVLLSYQTIGILENLGRSEADFELFRISNISFQLGRTSSLYLTILVTIERYFSIISPVKTKEWLTVWRSRFGLIAILIFSFLINLPWMCKSTVVENDVYGWSNSNDTFPSTLSEFPYFIKRNKYAKMLNKNVQESLLGMNYFVPFPLLLILNGLLFKSIHTWTVSRPTLSGKQKRAINATKMFSFVVFILLSTHFVSCVVFIMSRFYNLVYRELMLVQSLCVVFGAAVNFLVYYMFGRGFRLEFWRYAGLIFRNRCACVTECQSKLKKDLPSASSSHDGLD